MVKKKSLEYEKYISLAEFEAEKSHCARRHVGAVIAKNGHIISTGYNGVPDNLIDCTSEKPCFKNKKGIKSGTMVDDKDCRALHAELSAIINAAKNGKDTTGTTLFCTHHPCIGCALAIVSADIREVVYKFDYPDDLAKEFFKKAGITTIQFNKGVIKNAKKSMIGSFIEASDQMGEESLGVAKEAL